MAQFMFAYHGGSKPETPEKGAELMARWNAWVNGLGEKAVNPGSPLGMSKTVSADGVTDEGGSNPLMGFSVIEAETMEAALELAKSCPHLEMDTATIEVAEMMSM